ncbi:MAG: M50 family metallopeptidase [Clostridiales bacterium]|nr:M50 family metallopeptidase [Clostridiales bacterium]
MEPLSLITFSAIWSKAWPIIIAIFFFGLIIMFHELGHFLFARLFDVQINEFSMGMGPCLFKKKKGETQYSLRLLPIGGYVSMEGENKGSENERAFCNKKPWQRLIIIMAGGIINILLGVVIIAVMNSTGDLVGTRYIHSFREGAVSSNYGLKQGDEILKIDNRFVFSDYDINFLMSRSKDGLYDFTVKRDGEKIKLTGVQFKTVRLENSKTNTIISDFIIVGEEPHFLNIVTSSFRETASFARMVWLSLFDLVTGRYGLSDLSGPIGTVEFVAEAANDAIAKTDYTYLLAIMALITVNLGVFNLLPLPALDGGRAFFAFVEMIIGRPVSRKYEGWIHAVGLVLLLAFMAVVCASDIWKLIKG